MPTDPFLDTLQENLNIIKERQRAVETQRRVCVEELSRRICADRERTDPKEIYARFKERLPDYQREDLMILCQHLFSPAAPSALEHEPSNASLSADARATIALVHNPYNQAAYQSFASGIIGAKAYPVPSFSDACEDVFDGRCEFCILPIENAQDGRLFSFYGMIDRYDLRICAITEVETESNTGTIFYALVGKTLPDRIPKGARWHLEGMIVEQAGTLPSELFGLTKFFGAHICKLDTLPLPYNDHSQRFYFRIRLAKHHAEAVHFYLSQRYNRYTNIGLYPKL